MLKITIRTPELWDKEKEEFLFDEYEVELEHSLVALSKWESEYEKFFISSDPRSEAEIVGYVRCMNLTPEIPPEVFSHLSSKNVEEINAYINAKMTATTFPTLANQPASREQISSELIYFWMTSYNIPWEAQYWHLSRLFTLIKVFNVKNADPKKNKMNREDIIEKRRALNEQRKREMGTAG